MSDQRLVLRARQIRALYQRELTALHRRPGLTEDEMREQEEVLWRQAAEKLAWLREQTEQDGVLSDAGEAVFALLRPAQRDAG